MVVLEDFFQALHSKILMLDMRLLSMEENIYVNVYVNAKRTFLVGVFHATIKVIYPKCTLNIDLILWHTQLIVYAVKYYIMV